jgi:hypothetical protein
MKLKGQNRGKIKPKSAQGVNFDVLLEGREIMWFNVVFGLIYRTLFSSPVEKISWLGKWLPGGQDEIL